MKKEGDKEKKKRMRNKEVRNECIEERIENKGMGK